MSYRRQARAIVNECLRLCGLDKSHRCTQIHIAKDLRIDGNGTVWGYMRPTSDSTFVLGLNAGMSDARLRQVIGHEVGHIMVNEIIRCKGRNQTQWEEFTCDVIGNLLARALQDV